MSLPAEKARIGQYEIISQLDAPERELYYAVRGRQRVILAVFDIPVESRLRLHEEALRCQQLEHPAIVPIVDTFESNQQQVLVYETVKGISLMKLMEDLQTRKEELPDGAILHIGEALMGALAAAHDSQDAEGKRKPILHGEIGPHQIFVTWEGQPKLLGIGLSSVFALAIQHGSVPACAQPFVAPEVREGKAMTPRSNAYSAALLLWSLLARQPPPENERLRSLKKLRPDLSSAVTLRLDQTLTHSPRARMSCALLTKTIARNLERDDRLALRWTMELVRSRMPTVAPMPLESMPPRHFDESQRLMESVPPMSDDDMFESPTSPVYEVPAELRGMKLPTSSLPPPPQPDDNDALFDDDFGLSAIDAIMRPPGGKPATSPGGAAAKAPAPKAGTPRASNPRASNPKVGTPKAPPARASTPKAPPARASTTAEAIPPPEPAPAPAAASSEPDPGDRISVDQIARARALAPDTSYKKSTKLSAGADDTGRAVAAQRSGTVSHHDRPSNSDTDNEITRVAPRPKISSPGAASPSGPGVPPPRASGPGARGGAGEETTQVAAPPARPPGASRLGYKKRQKTLVGGLPEPQPSGDAQGDRARDELPTKPDDGARDDKAAAAQPPAAPRRGNSTQASPTRRRTPADDEGTTVSALPSVTPKPAPKVQIQLQHAGGTADDDDIEDALALPPELAGEPDPTKPTRGTRPGPPIIRVEEAAPASAPAPSAYPAAPSPSVYPIPGHPQSVYPAAAGMIPPAPQSMPPSSYGVMTQGYGPAHSMNPHAMAMMGPHSMGPHSMGPHSMGPHSMGVPPSMMHLQGQAAEPPKGWVPTRWVIITAATAVLFFVLGLLSALGVLQLSWRDTPVAQPTPPPATAAPAATAAATADRPATTGAEPTAAPSATPSAEPSAVASSEPSAAATASSSAPDDTDLNAAALPPNSGYLIVTTPYYPDGQVYWNGTHRGKIDEAIVVFCGAGFLRLGNAPLTRWYSDGQPVAVKCQAVTRVPIDQWRPAKSVPRPRQFLPGGL